MQQEDDELPWPFQFWRGGWYERYEQRYVPVDDATVRCHVARLIDSDGVSVRAVADYMEGARAQNEISFHAMPPCHATNRLPDDLIITPTKAHSVSDLVKQEYSGVVANDASLFTLSSMPCEIDSEAAEPKQFVSFLKQAFRGVEDQIPVLQEMLGYCLMASKDDWWRFVGYR
jgi:hypothetical protein